MSAVHGYVELAIACNDYRHGVCDGLCRAIALAEGMLTLESPYDDRHLRFGLACDVRVRGRRHLVLGARRCWPIIGSRRWVGNWCWNAYLMSAADAADMLNFVASKGYRPTSGWVDLCMPIDRGVPLTAEVLAPAIRHVRHWS